MIREYSGRTPKIADSAFIAESADVIGEVEVSMNASVWFQTVLRGDIEPIRIGAHTNIQDGSVLHTIMGSPVIVGDWVTVGHRVVLHGCTIESHCLIGMGAILLNNVRVGEGSIVAAGALVLENTTIPRRSLYVGVPARFQRQLTDADRVFIDAHAQHYLQYKENYLAETAKLKTS
jgi:carbonic anhydrase/acetyltransferase-like protein (isoleucine patch superfamily)